METHLCEHYDSRRVLSSFIQSCEVEICVDNNDVMRRIRYIFDLNDAKMQEIFVSTGYKANVEQIRNWLKKDDDPAFKQCDDRQLAIFLNGFINEKRGKKEGEQPQPEKRLTNNIILRKLKIALDLRDVDVLQILERAEFRLGKAELSAFFRKTSHKHYRSCKDQVLRNFLMGLQYTHRNEKVAPVKSPWKQD